MSETNIDAQLKDLILRDLPSDDSYRSQTIILSNNCDNDVVRLILERAKIKIIDIADAFFRKPEIRVPFEIDPFDVSRLLRVYDGISSIESVRSGRVADLDFQVHKHAMIQQSVANICRLNVAIEDDTSVADCAYFDGFEPADFGLFYATTPALDTLIVEDGCVNIPDNSFAIVNLFDSSVTITSLYIAMNQDRISGCELFLILPYDERMWTVTSANVLDGAYSYQWVRSDLPLPDDNQYVPALSLPTNFFDLSQNPYELRIRPYYSNKILKITRDEFIAVFAHGSERRSFPETRRISHGFAEVSIINFYPVLEDGSHAGIRNVKRSNILYTKKLVRRKNYNNSSFKPRFNFAKALEPPWEYVIDDKLFDKTRKAAIQTRITRNLIVPLIYHLFAHSTHIVFNGAIVTLQKVMSPELICQLTEHILFDVIPIKIKILQAGNAIRANNVIKSADILTYALKSILIYAYDKTGDLEGLTKIVADLISNPLALIENDIIKQNSKTAETIVSSSLPIIAE